MHHPSIIRLIEKTLNYVDPRLIDHGKRVAYLVYTMLKRSGKYSEDVTGKVVVLALLHDIGAYKTEEIDKMVQFEMDNVWEHSAYGYLFIKNFSPLSDLAPTILFHHANCQELTHLTPSMRELAQAIHIADRFDVLTQTGNLDNNAFKEHFDKLRDTKFYSNLVDLLFWAGWENLLSNIDDDREFHDMLYHWNLSDSDIDAYTRMIVLAIDFKSAQTVTHTFAMAYVCRFITRFINVNPDEKYWMYMGTMLHDLGKISTPLEILEKPGRLTEPEMEIMKKHVEVTEQILSGEVDDSCVRLSVCHHEKLNGGGYPRGLKAEDLTTGQRIVAVGDIFSALYGVRTYKDSFSNEKVIGILEDMANQGMLDKVIVSVTVENIDYIVNELKNEVEPIIDVYKQMQSEYTGLLVKAKNFKNEDGTGEIIS